MQISTLSKWKLTHRIRVTCRQKFMPDRPGFCPLAAAVGFTVWVIALSSRGRPGVLGTSQQRITDLTLPQVHRLPTMIMRLCRTTFACPGHNTATHEWQQALPSDRSCEHAELERYGP